MSSLYSNRSRLTNYALQKRIQKHIKNQLNITLQSSAKNVVLLDTKPALLTSNIQSVKSSQVSSTTLLCTPENSLCTTNINIVRPKFNPGNGLPLVYILKIDIADNFYNNFTIDITCLTNIIGLVYDIRDSFGFEQKTINKNTQNENNIEIPASGQLHVELTLSPPSTYHVPFYIYPTKFDRSNWVKNIELTICFSCISNTSQEKVTQTQFSITPPQTIQTHAIPINIINKNNLITPIQYYKYTIYNPLTIPVIIQFDKFQQVTSSSLQIIVPPKSTLTMLCEHVVELSYETAGHDLYSIFSMINIYNINQKESSQSIQDLLVNTLVNSEHIYFDFGGKFTLFVNFNNNATDVILSKPKNDYLSISYVDPINFQPLSQVTVGRPLLLVLSISNIQNQNNICDNLSYVCHPRLEDWLFSGKSKGKLNFNEEGVFKLHITFIPLQQGTLLPNLNLLVSNSNKQIIKLNFQPLVIIPETSVTQATFPLKL